MTTDEVFLENSDSVQENFAEMLASRGFTLSFYTMGVDVGINQAMRRAVADRKDIFNLLQEVFTFPNRPWDLRKLALQGQLNVYDECREILNKPAEPELAWVPQENWLHSRTVRMEVSWTAKVQTVPFHGWFLANYFGKVDAM